MRMPRQAPLHDSLEEEDQKGGERRKAFLAFNLDNNRRVLRQTLIGDYFSVQLECRHPQPDE
jgi:hypothetical protein